MRYFAIDLVLFIGFSGVCLASFEFRLLVLSFILLMLLMNRYLQLQTILRRKFAGQVRIKSEKKSISVLTVTLVGLWILFFVIETNNQFSFLPVFAAFLIVEIFENFLYRRYRPVTLIIDNRELIINGSWITRRNLEGLVRVRLESTQLVCSFVDSRSITINFNEYNRKDMEKFIKSLKSKSNYAVEFSKNLHFA